jgi:hypothetical protein
MSDPLRVQTDRAPPIDPCGDARSRVASQGKGMPKVARECGVGSGTVQRIKQEMKGAFVGVAA